MPVRWDAAQSAVREELLRIQLLQQVPRPPATLARSVAHALGEVPASSAPRRAYAQREQAEEPALVRMGAQAWKECSACARQAAAVRSVVQV
jgi:hypothetical protein